MNYVLIGSLGNINSPLVSRLVAAGSSVTVVSSNPERAAAIVAAGARPAIGDIRNIDFLTATFTGADAVYTMVPPKWDATDWKQYIHETGKLQAEAVKAAGVKKVVNLSSIGAHMPAGCGPVSGIHFVEEEFNQLAGVDVKHLRPGYFFNNLFAATGMIKHAGFYGNNYGDKEPLILADPADIAAAAAEELLALSFTGKSSRYVVSDQRTSRDVAAVLGAAVGKPALPYVEFSDEDTVKGMLQAGLSEEVARNYAEMGVAIRSGEMFSDYKKHPVPLGATRLEDFAKKFAAAYAAA